MSLHEFSGRLLWIVKEEGAQNWIWAKSIKTGDEVGGRAGFPDPQVETGLLPVEPYFPGGVVLKLFGSYQEEQDLLKDLDLTNLDIRDRVSEEKLFELSGIVGQALVQFRFL